VGFRNFGFVIFAEIVAGEAARCDMLPGHETPAQLAIGKHRRCPGAAVGRRPVRSAGRFRTGVVGGLCCRQRRHLAKCLHSEPGELLTPMARIFPALCKLADGASSEPRDRRMRIRPMHLVEGSIHVGLQGGAREFSASSSIRACSRYETAFSFPAKPDPLVAMTRTLAPTANGPEPWPGRSLFRTPEGQ